MNVQPVGNHLRRWRQQRRLSQLDLALGAEISARHLSFLETGRASPSREMLMRLAEHLDIPIRERNVLLVAAGYAPVFAERSLDDPALAPARAAIDLMLQAYRPYPAFALDRHWNIVASNGALPEAYVDVDPSLLTPPINVMRLSLHPKGLAPRIVNFGEYRAHLLHRLRAQVELTADPTITDLYREVLAYPSQKDGPTHHGDGVVVPMCIRVGEHVLSFLTTTMVFGTPLDVTLSELAVETMFPSDQQTFEIMRTLAAG